MNTIPVYLLTGYLGSGKTTLLNHLLSTDALRSRRVALIVNEFGSLGVDGQLVGKDAGQVFELNRGSLFCSCIKTDFQRTLKEIAEEVKPDLVIAEATGVAQTIDLCSFFDQPHARRQFRIAADVCVVDSRNFTKILPFLKAATAQVRWADALVINKADQTDPAGMDRLSRLLREMNPRAVQIQTVHSQVEWEFIEKLNHQPSDEGPVESPPEQVSTCSLPSRLVDREVFQEAYRQVGDRLLRAKGIVDFGEGPVLLEGVFEQISEHPVTTADPRFGLTLIGWNISGDELADAFRPALRSASTQRCGSPLCEP